mgnify:CR=1 FL=1
MDNQMNNKVNDKKRNAHMCIRIKVAKSEARRHFIWAQHISKHIVQFISVLYENLVLI